MNLKRFGIWFGVILVIIIVIVFVIYVLAPWITSLIPVTKADDAGAQVTAIFGTAFARQTDEAKSTKEANATATGQAMVENAKATVASMFGETLPAPTATPENTVSVPTPTPTIQTAIASGTSEPTATPRVESNTTGSDPEGTDLINSKYMVAYQDSREYKVPADLQVPGDLLDGFTPVSSLVLTDLILPKDAQPIPSYQVVVPAAPSDVIPFSCFPQDYKEGDSFNRGCKELQLQGALPWEKPVAGYNDGENWSCDSTDGWCADDIQALDWRVITGYEVCHPAVGCLKDPDGGAVMILFINFHDSDEIWNVRTDSAIYVDAGFIGYGRFWDLSGGTYNVGKGIAALRNHYFYNLSYDVGRDNRYSGQCGTSGLCQTITYVTVARVWDRPELGINYSHFELIDFGQWRRP